MFDCSLRIHCQREPFSDRISVSFATVDMSGAMSIADPLAFTSRSSGDISEPCVSFTNTEAQKLMDDLWNCGLRPSEGTGSAGSLAATERHLKDMRTLVFTPPPRKEET